MKLQKQIERYVPDKGLHLISQKEQIVLIQCANCKLYSTTIAMKIRDVVERIYYFCIYLHSIQIIGRQIATTNYKHLQANPRFDVCE